MTPRKSQTPATPEQATDRLAEAIDRLTDRLQVVQDCIDDLRTDFQHAVRSLPPIYTMPSVLPKNPADPKWYTKILAANQEKPCESLACAFCDIDSPDSLADALAQGWTRLQEDLDGLGHNYLGRCPSCLLEQEQEDKPPVEAPAASQVPQKSKNSLF